MGMFDFLCILDPVIQNRVRCAHGHPATDKTDFHTKDLDCGMDSLYITDGYLYRVSGAWLADETFPTPPEPPGDRVDYTGQVRFYGNCDECPTTYWVSKDPEKRVVAPGGWIWPQSSRPWTEYVALIHRGKVIALEPVQLETLKEDADKMSEFWIQSDEDGVVLVEDP